MGVSRDGNRLACRTGTQLIVMDRAAGTNFAIGAQVSSTHPDFRFSDDSRWFAFSRMATASINQVYLFDFDTYSAILVSHPFASAAEAAGNSYWPEISADGRFVVYRSSATNLVAGVTNGMPNLILYDQVSGSNALLTSSRFGTTPADNRSFGPFFTGDGHTLLFQSFASDLVEGDWNHSADVFAYRLFYATFSTLAPAPTITWPAGSGRSYQVEYKDNLADLAWLPASGTITITGATGTFVESPPPAGQRFYRVSSF
jgi:hypothetical protein